jgi:hypothetical protein
MPYAHDFDVAGRVREVKYWIAIIVVYDNLPRKIETIARTLSKFAVRDIGAVCQQRGKQ